MRAGLNDRTASAQTGRRYSLLPIKYRETEGIKDATDIKYTASRFEVLYNWEDTGNSQGATKVIKSLKSLGERKYLPSNPTHPSNWTNLRYQKWNGEEWVTVGAVPSTWYDCSSWGYFYTPPTYEYLGYYPSSYEVKTDTKTFLVKT